MKANIRHSLYSLGLLFTLHLSFVSPLAAAPIAVTDNNTPALLLGFDDIIVDGTSYSVRFVEGSYNSLFSGGLDFSTLAQATDASTALDIVYSLYQPFDQAPARTFGCTTTTFDLCDIVTPYASSPSLLISTLINTTDENLDNVSQGNDIKPNDDTTINSAVVYARWTPSSTTVPEPTAMLLIATGILGLAGAYRRKMSA